MTPSELTARVTWQTCALIVVMAVPAAWLGGRPAALGVLAGGALAVGNFRWLVARAMTAAPGRGAGWLVGAALRFLAFIAACAVLLASGLVHPVALLAGFVILPCDVLLEGARAAREEPS
jgi:ATP synthase I subunit